MLIDNEVIRRRYGERLGALIYIKHQDESGRPLNFYYDAENRTANSGNWSVNLKSRKFEWVMVFWRRGKEKLNKVWIGDFDKTSKNKIKPFVFRFKNVNEYETKMSLKELTGRNEPQQPTFICLEEDSLERDLAAIEKDKKIPETERTTLIEARLGQGRFRKSVLNKWNGKCAVTGINIRNVIRASHIKPWRVCNDVERLSADNGLPLIANLDALFDALLISFKRNGDMLVSQKIGSKEKILLQIPQKLSRPLTDEQEKFMRVHRLEFSSNKKAK